MLNGMLGTKRTHGMAARHHMEVKAWELGVASIWRGENSCSCLSIHGTHNLRQAQNNPESLPYLESNTVLNEQLLGEQPSPCHAVTDIAAFGVDGVQGRLASTLFPYLR